MGGAERAAKKRQQTGAVAAARRTGLDRQHLIVGAIAVVLVAAAVVGGILWTNSQRNATEGATISVVEDREPLYKRHGAEVHVGYDNAFAKIDIYEDMLCPACRAFEDANGQKLLDAVVGGDIQIRYHLLNMLDARSDPAGYSTDAANAVLLAADKDKFFTMKKSLFAAQPAEGTRGWSRDQLIELARAAGLNDPAYENDVRSGRLNAEITQEFQQSRSNPTLQQDAGDGRKAFGTPLVVCDDEIISTANENWIADLVKKKKGEQGP